MGLDDQTGAVGEVGGSLQGRFVREEELQLLGRIGSGLAAVHACPDLVRSELAAGTGDEAAYLADAVVSKDFQSNNQIRRSVSGEIIEVRLAAVPLEDSLGLLLA
jgi:hypothetical protein